MRALEHAHATRDGVEALFAALDRLERAPVVAAPALPAPPVVAPAARDALVAVDAAATATLAVPREALVAALDAALDAGDAEAGQRAFDAFDAAARDARMASRTALALLPAPPDAAAVAPLSRAAALVRDALRGADVVHISSFDDARALVRESRAACDAVVEERRRGTVALIYGGDGVAHMPRGGNPYMRYGGSDESNTSPLIDTLRALYDYARAKRRDNIEQLARDLYARGMGRLGNFLGGLVPGQQAMVVWRLVPNKVGGRVEIKFRRPTRRDLHTGRGRARGR